MRRGFAVIGMLVVFLLGCSLPTPAPIVVTATPNPSSEPTAQPPVAVTATPEEAVIPTEKPETAPPTEQPTAEPPKPTATQTESIPPTATLQDRLPPADLGPGFTGLIFREGECWDADLWGMVADNRCDFRLDPILILQPVNGARISGRGRMSAPSLFDCMAEDLRADPVAPNTNIYLCIHTNDGFYGYLVQRPDAPGAPLNRLILDYWLYK